MPDFRARVTELNDADLTALLARADVRAVGHRGLLTMIKTAVTACLDDRSCWYGDPRALVAVPTWLAALRGLPATHGLFDSDGNLASPPDTSFSVNDMGIVARLLADVPADVPAAAALRDMMTDLRAIMADLTPALVTGGVHTPNHRWELASALARLDATRPDPVVRARIEEWLAEGIDVDADGLYSERSANYAAHVTNPSLLNLAAHLDRPDLRRIVHSNLHAYAVLTDADGLVETVHSRRQDQGKPFSAAAFVGQYRRFALLDDCRICAAAALVAEAGMVAEAGTTAAAVGVLAEMLLEPALGRALPDRDPDTPPDVVGARCPGVTTFRAAGLVRINRERSTTTVYGGSDVPHVGRIASGLACDPTFLRWRHGDVALDAVRLSRTFFGLGPFRAAGLVEVERGDVSVVRLQEELRAAYYQPLAPDRRRPDGAYALEDESRFSAALAFSARDRDDVELTTELTITAGADEVRVDAAFEGAVTSYAFELTFRPGGVLSGVRPLPGTDTFELVEGHGRYEVGRDAIAFGPGTREEVGPPGYDPGSAYTVPAGSDATTGVKVYLTGRTSGRRTLLLRAASLHEPTAAG